MFILFHFVCSIHVVIALNSREDLSITKYSYVGCLKLKLDKQFIVNNIQENSLSPYQTFSSSHMTIELCFRICRRWTILMFNNQTICICLYTINKPYEFNEYLGEFLSVKNCTSNDVKIYSLTNDLYLLPVLSTAANDDWSLDGCYSLHGIQSIRVNFWLDNVDYIQAIELCRKYCQRNRRTNYFSYFLSRKKSCYCLPVKLYHTVKPAALRKPLLHCSFLPYICQGFSTSCEKFHSKINVDTLVKIDVQHYCSSLNDIFFTFDRLFYKCFTSIPLQADTNFSTIHNEQKCIPLVIKTYEQWRYLIESSWITQAKLFVWIDRNSTYVLNHLFDIDNSTLSWQDVCLMLYRTEQNHSLYELVECSLAQSPGFVLCAQKPIQSTIPYEEEFNMIKNETLVAIDGNLTCPLEFILFNNVCYYVHSSFIYTIRSGERICLNQHPNSTLVKHDSQEFGNINATRFLGRIFGDILTEFFYYSLEHKLLNESIGESNKKHWLRLLFANKDDPNECVLRHFARLPGTFTTFSRCSNGGHPVCQYEPMRRGTSSVQDISDTLSTVDYEQTTVKLQNRSFTAESITAIINISNRTYVLRDEDYLSNSSIPDMFMHTNSMVDLDESPESIFEQSKHKRPKQYPLILVFVGPSLALIALIIAIVLLIHYVRGAFVPSSTGSSLIDSNTAKYSPAMLSANDFRIAATAPDSLPKCPEERQFTELDTFLSVEDSIPPNDPIELPSTVITGETH